MLRHKVIISEPYLSYEGFISLHAGVMFLNLSFCWLSFKTNFSQQIFHEHYTIKVSNALEPDHDTHLVGPNLGPNCLQKLSAEDKSHL